MFTLEWRHVASPRRKPHVGKPKKMRRWVYDGYNRAVEAATKSEARAAFKRILCLPRLHRNVEEVR